MPKTTSEARSIQSYITRLPPDVEFIMERIREAIRCVAPNATARGDLDRGRHGAVAGRLTRGLQTDGGTRQPVSAQRGQAVFRGRPPFAPFALAAAALAVDVACPPRRAI